MKPRELRYAREVVRKLYRTGNRAFARRASETVRGYLKFCYPPYCDSRYALSYLLAADALRAMSEMSQETFNERAKVG